MIGIGPSRARTWAATGCRRAGERFEVFALTPKRAGSFKCWSYIDFIGAGDVSQKRDVHFT